MYLTHIPSWVQKLYPSYTWRIPSQENVLYLTFDDGPTAEITSWVVDQLEQFQAKATFFVIGKNVKAHPEILRSTLQQGHTVGNHTYLHDNGRKTDLYTYTQSIQKTQEVCQEVGNITPTLFRPPYGRMTLTQIQEVKQQYPIMMMDIISADFDTRETADRCASGVCQHAKPGSIILFHDSVKAFPRLKEALPKVLSHFSKLGYQFRSLPESF
ncbi:MAG: polysaccharide deacetylase family protein [Bacteroidota bacterium]